VPHVGEDPTVRPQSNACSPLTVSDHGRSPVSTTYELLYDTKPVFVKVLSEVGVMGFRGSGLLNQSHLADTLADT
jgi:hypothetical protein